MRVSGLRKVITALELVLIIPLLRGVQVGHVRLSGMHEKGSRRQ